MGSKPRVVRGGGEWEWRALIAAVRDAVKIKGRIGDPKSPVKAYQLTTREYENLAQALAKYDAATKGRP